MLLLIFGFVDCVSMETQYFFSFFFSNLYRYFCLIIKKLR
jgi:hypothetical protein